MAASGDRKCQRKHLGPLLPRLLHSLSLVAIGLSVGKETWPPIGWHHPFVIGWSKYRLGLPSAPLHYGLMWPVGIPTLFQTPVTVPLHSPNGRQKPVVGAGKPNQIAYLAPSHYLNQCWVIVNWTIRNKLKSNFNRNTKLFIQEIASENIVCKMSAILSSGRWVKLNSLSAAIYITWGQLSFTELQPYWFPLMSYWHTQVDKILNHTKYKIPSYVSLLNINYRNTWKYTFSIYSHSFG